MNVEKLLKELEFKASRSSGAGGQHVNKTASRISVFFDVAKSEALSDQEKVHLKKQLASRLSGEGVLILSSESSRSQHKNKKLVIERLIAFLQEHLKPQKPRKKTKPSKGVVEKRLKLKKQQALKKKNRQAPDF